MRKSLVAFLLQAGATVLGVALHFGFFRGMLRVAYAPQAALFTAACLGVIVFGLRLTAFNDLALVVCLVVGGAVLIGWLSRKEGPKWMTWPQTLVAVALVPAVTWYMRQIDPYARGTGWLEENNLAPFVIGLLAITVILGIQVLESRRNGPR